MRDILEDAENAVERGDIGPGKANRGRDNPKFPKRFYSEVVVAEHEEGHVVLLDGKAVKTPGRKELVLPTLAAAELVRSEWENVQSEINPLLMPVTRLANTAIDGVEIEMQAVVEDILRYAASDMLCYRAETPEGLVKSQKEHWDNILDWVSEDVGAHFETSGGIMHVTQPREAISAFGNRLQNHADPFSLACIHTFTSLSGSAIIALALAEGHLDGETAWKAAHVDEDWNISLWGEDHEAAERRKQRWTDFDAALKLFEAVSGNES